jgi:hypothetical protein
MCVGAVWDPEAPHRTERGHTPMSQALPPSRNPLRN